MADLQSDYDDGFGCTASESSVAVIFNPQDSANGRRRA
jgi:hypothetical protein